MFESYHSLVDMVDYFLGVTLKPTNPSLRPQTGLCSPEHSPVFLYTRTYNSIFYLPTLTADLYIVHHT